MHSVKSKAKHIHHVPDKASYTGTVPEDGVTIEQIQYGVDVFNRSFVDDIVFTPSPENETNWINICGLTQSTFIREVLQGFQVGKMTIEDILHIGQRAKVDFYEHYTYAVMMMLTFNPQTDDIDYEQVSFILMDHTLISLQEKTGDVFEAIRDRIAQEKSIIRRKSSDYLLYTLIDAIVDNYYELLSVLEEKVEAFETTVINHPKNLKLNELYHLRKRISGLKITIEPIKELLVQLSHEDSPISDGTKLYLKDIQDHTNQIIDYTLTYREMLSNILDTFLSINSHRMNQIMTTLTIYSAIFIPLTFLAGVYGMNFRYMPELASTWGYPTFWVLSVVITLLMLLYFKLRKWIG